jgi:hypothetical protein
MRLLARRQRARALSLSQDQFRPSRKRQDTVGEFAGPEPLREKLFVAWHQTGREQDFCPDKHNHNAEYKLRLSPCSDFANSIRLFLRDKTAQKWLSSDVFGFFVAKHLLH